MLVEGPIIRRWAQEAVFLVMLCERGNLRDGALSHMSSIPAALLDK